MLEILRRNRPLLITALIVFAVLAVTAFRYEPRVFASMILSGLTLGALYFMVSSGLSLIFGLMDVLNFAHGLLFMFGAYIGYTMFDNPRMLLNTIPFVFALMGSAMIVSPFANVIWSRVKISERAVAYGLSVAAVALTIYALWDFNILALAANAATATGGSVTTELAQEAASPFAVRLGLLIAAGAVTGLVIGRGRSLIQSRNQWMNAAIGIVLVAASFLIIPFRTAGEKFFLDLPSNWRFVFALIAGASAGAGVGAMIEWGLIRPLYARPIYQVLVTLGLVYVGTELIRGVWGSAGFYMDVPDFFNTRGKNCPSPNLIAFLQDNCASIDVLGRPFPSYRIFIIGLGVAMFVGVALLLRYTRLGMIIRAGVQDGEMVQALGINVRQVFTMVFALGAGLSALGGVAAAPFIGVNLGIGQEFLLQAFISVVIGGMGSFTGATIGALLVGLARAFGDQWVLSGIQLPWMEQAVKMSPAVARASTVLIMAVVLLLRPAGLFGKKD